MPGRDGTGPIGMGRMGRGLGPCSGDAPGYGAGWGLGRRGDRGYGRGFGGYAAFDRDGAMTRKDALEEQKKLLEDRLNFVKKQLDEL